MSKSWGEQIIAQRDKIETVADARAVSSKIPRLKGAALFNYYNKKLSRVFSKINNSIDWLELTEPSSFKAWENNLTKEDIKTIAITYEEDTQRAYNDIMFHLELESKNA